MKKKMRRKLPGLLITTTLCLAMVLFLLGLMRTRLFPNKLVLLAGGVFLLLAVIVGLLTATTKRMGRMIVGMVLTLLILAGLVIGTTYLMDAVDTLSDMTQVKVEITDVGVFVPQDDPAQSLNDALEYHFGMIESQDRAYIDTAIEQMEAEFGVRLTVSEFAGLEELLNALFTEKRIDAIVINSAYLELLGEMEGYEHLDGQLRELHASRVETELQSVVPEETKSFLTEILESPEEMYVDPSFVVYISGIDSRSGLIAKSRSDVNILAVVNPDTRQVLLVSTPRDYYVPLPISQGVPDKLTHAGIYGVDVSIGTLEMLYQTNIDYYFRVNFSGFEKIIDSLGGITVYSDYSFSSGSYKFREGENQLSGAQALNFARERYAFAEGDRQRGRNQMAVIKGVINKAMSPAILTNYTALMDSVSGSFETSMPYDKIADLVRNQLEEGGIWNVVSISVDGTGATKRPYSMGSNAYVMIPDQDTVDAAIEKINKVRNGDILK